MLLNHKSVSGKNGVPVDVDELIQRFRGIGRARRRQRCFRHVDAVLKQGRLAVFVIQLVRLRSARIDMADLRVRDDSRQITGHDVAYARIARANDVAGLDRIP